MKTREWNSENMLVRWREAWAERQNQALQRKGLMQQVDHRSLAAQRSEALERGDRIAAATLDRTPEIHVGPKARKASRQQPPKSKVRLVGRKTKKGMRPLRYDEIDRGSRREWNMRNLQQNARAFGKLIAKTETRLVRMRKRLDSYNRVLAVHSSPASSLRWKRPHPIGVAGPSSSRVARFEHVRKRRRQLLWMIDQLDRLFLALLGIRESQLLRHTVWSNRLTWQRMHQMAPWPGHGRVRSRWLPS